ncbi:MAG: hypothetical protein Q8R95_07395 [Azonexus sp.]|nr:hypothetical protein [Azonexus sp.]
MDADHPRNLESFARCFTHYDDLIDRFACQLGAENIMTGVVVDESLDVPVTPKVCLTLSELGKAALASQSYG